MVVSIWDFHIADDALIYVLLDKQVAESFMTALLAGMICWKPASIFVSKIFCLIPDTVSKAEGWNGCDNTECPYRPGPEHEEEVKIGSWIGILEREIILILGVMNQFGAIGFVLTAKSLARFKQLENKAFAEKYLVGTLMSTIIAMVCVLMCKAL